MMIIILHRDGQLECPQTRVIIIITIIIVSREGQLECVKLLASRGAGLDAKTEVTKIKVEMLLDHPEIIDESN